MSSTPMRPQGAQRIEERIRDTAAPRKGILRMVWKKCCQFVAQGFAGSSRRQSQQSGGAESARVLWGSGFSALHFP